MAQIIHSTENINETKIKKKNSLCIKITVVSFIVSLIILLINYIAHGSIGVSVIPMVIGVACVIFIQYDLQILRAGLAGENAGLELSTQLTDKYLVFPNVSFSFEGKKTEVDLLIVGPNGAMVVEIKNHNGSIQGSEEATHWIQHKVGVKGGEYSSEMRNPIKQMKRQVYLLSSLLKSQGIRVWIDGVVVFTNPDVTLNITESSAQVIKGNNFLSTIHSLSHPIDHQSIEKIKKFVLQLNEKAA